MNEPEKYNEDEPGEMLRTTASSPVSPTKGGGDHDDALVS